MGTQKIIGTNSSNVPIQNRRKRTILTQEDIKRILEKYDKNYRISQEELKKLAENKDFLDEYLETYFKAKAKIIKKKFGID